MTPDAPPKQPVNGTEAVRMDDPDTALPRYTEGNSTERGNYSEASALVALRSGSQQGNDSFPVLKALQDYLEAERVRSRQRTTMLSCIFAGIIVIILITFGLIWHSIVQSGHEREAMLLQVALANKGQTPAVNVEVPAPAQSKNENTAALVATAVAKAQADQAALFAEKLDTMNKLVASIQQDNAKMKAELGKRPTAASPKPIAKKPQPTTAAKTVKTAAKPKSTAKEPSILSIPTVPPPPSPKGYASGSFGVRLPKEPNPLPWRIYMPMK